MSGYTQVFTLTAADQIEVFNRAVAQAARPDFKDLPVTQCVETVEILHGLLLKNEIFADPVVELMATLLGDESFAVRELIATAMCGAILQYEDIAPDAMSVLACLRDDEYAEVRRTVAKMTGVAGYRKKDMYARAIDLLDTMKSDDNVVVRREVANAIRLIGTSGPAQADAAKKLLLEMKPDLDHDLNQDLDERRREIDKAADRDFEDPPLLPPFSFG